MESEVKQSGIYAALVAVQSECEAPKKNASNPHFKSKFADLTQVLEVLHAPLAENGLAIVQMPVTNDKTVGVHTLIVHTSGESLDCGTCLMPLERPGPQSAGSAITYARRYSLMSIFRLSAEDDDGETAEGRGTAPKAPRTLDDVAKASVPDDGRPVVAEVVKCGIKWDGTLPQLPKGVPPVMPGGEHEGKAMDTVPVGYLRSIYGKITKPELKQWAEYLITAHAFSKINGGM
jgi:hypothetical protein